MSTALLQGQTQAQEAQAQTLAQEGQGGESVKIGGEEVKPWPLLGVLPYFNPFLQEGQREGQRGNPHWTGSVTGLQCLPTSSTPADKSADTSAGPPAGTSAVNARGTLTVAVAVLQDRSHWGSYRGSGRGRERERGLLIELPNMFTTLYQQVREKDQVRLSPNIVAALRGAVFSSRY